MKGKLRIRIDDVEYECSNCEIFASVVTAVTDDV